jgi:hypothetical protein
VRNSLTDEERLASALEALEAALEAAGEARATAEAMDERRRQVRAALIVKYRTAGKAVGEAAEFAMADPVYSEAANVWQEANYAYRRTDARAEGKRASWDTWRSRAATERAKIGLR